MIDVLSGDDDRVRWVERQMEWFSLSDIRQERALSLLKDKEVEEVLKPYRALSSSHKINKKARKRNKK